MVNLLGSVIIILSCYLIGKSINLRYEYRIYDIENLLSVMKVFENEIRYNLNDIPCVINIIYPHLNENNKLIFESFLKETSSPDKKALSQVWTNSVDENKKMLYYHDNDIKTIKDFGLVLGSGDANTQTKNIDCFIKALVDLLDNSRNEQTKKNKIYSKLSIYIALVIIVLII